MAYEERKRLAVWSWSPPNPPAQCLPGEGRVRGGAGRSQQSQGSCLHSEGTVLRGTDGSIPWNTGQKVAAPASVPEWIPVGGLCQLPLTFSLLSLIPVSLTETVLDGAILEPEAKGENSNIGPVFILFFVHFLHWFWLLKYCISIFFIWLLRIWWLSSILRLRQSP